MSTQSRATPWMEQFRAQLAAAAGLTDEGPAVAFTTFDALDERLAPSGLSRHDVLSQVGRGIFRLDRAGGSTERPRYRMFTDRLDVRLHTEPWVPDPEQRIVVLDNATRRTGPPHSEWLIPVVPASVGEFPSREGRTFDVDALSVELGRRRDVAEAGQTLTKVRLTPRRQAELRAEVRRRYGSLRALLQLARTRADFGEDVGGPGTVVDGGSIFTADDPRARMLVVRTHADIPFPDEEGVEVTLTTSQATDRPFRFVVADYSDRLLVLVGRSRHPKPGTEVVVTQAEKFRYQRHERAVRAFFDERDVVGNWSALATLLCRPGDLMPPESVAALGPTSLPLNVEQREAVAGAVAAPHAFFVQGPPGTGKTQVIVELVNRLVARGERVLLTAPTHVAVDEVLRRLDDARGVLPVRLSYSDAKVDPVVLRFTESGYDSMLSRDLRLPASSEQPRRLARVVELGEHRTALADWHAANEENRDARGSLTATEGAVAQRDEERRATRAHLATALDRLTASVADQAQKLTALSASADALDRDIARLESTRGLLGRIADALRLGALSKARARRRRVDQDHATTGQRYLDAAARYDADKAIADHRFDEMRRKEDDDQRAVDAARHRASRAAMAAARCHRRLAELGLGALTANPKDVPTRIARIDEERDALTARIEVQQRWFDLCGADGHDDAADRSRAAKIVGRALSSAINLVCSTTTGIGGNPRFRDLDYDTLIVDEASKVTGAEFLIPGIRARRWILVGDEKQLPPYVEPRDEHHLHAMAAIHASERVSGRSTDEAVRDLAELWEQREDAEQHPFRIQSVQATVAKLLESDWWARAHRLPFTEQIQHIAASDEPERELLEAMDAHLVRSLFEQAVGAVDDGLRKRLVQQRRMPRQIAELVRTPVYQGMYDTPDDGAPAPLLTPSFPTPVVFLDTSAQPDPWDHQTGTSFVNRLEADWAEAVCRQWARDVDGLGLAKRPTISVLSFYAAQSKLIRKHLGAPAYRGFPGLEFRVVDSIDRIQGQESDLVVISFCRTHGRPKDERRRNTSPSTPATGYARWLQNLNRLNVACTRARRSLVLIGHADTLKRLRGVPGGEAFYANLFELPSNVLTMRKDWVLLGRGRRR